MRVFEALSADYRNAKTIAALTTSARNSICWHFVLANITPTSPRGCLLWLVISVFCGDEKGAPLNNNLLGVRPVIGYDVFVREGGVPGGDAGASLKPGRESCRRIGMDRFHLRAQFLRSRRVG